MVCCVIAAHGNHRGKDDATQAAAIKLNVFQESLGLKCGAKPESKIEHCNTTRELELYKHLDKNKDRVDGGQ